MKFKTSILVLVLLLGSSRAHAVMRLVKLQGDLTVQAGGKFLSPKVGSVFYDGTVLRTGARGSAVLLHPEGHALRVWPLSVVTLNANELTGKVPRVSLKEGKVFIQAVKVLKDREIFQVETSETLAGVRGTAFSVERLAESGTQVDVLEGTVYVRSLGVERLIQAGFSSLVPPGLPPPIPSPMRRERFEDMQEGARDTGKQREPQKEDGLRGSLPEGLKREGETPSVVKEMVMENKDLSVFQKLDIIRELSADLVTEQIREELIQKLEGVQGSATFIVD